MEKNQGMDVSVDRKMERRWAETSEGLMYLIKAEIFVGSGTCDVISWAIGKSGCSFHQL